MRFQKLNKPCTAHPFGGSVTRLLAVAAAGFLASTIAAAQTFDSGSTGADGALDLSGVAAGTTLVFNPRAFDPPLDPDGDSIYHFTTITIPAGVTVKMSAREMGFAPVFWLASGAVDIAGAIDLNGEDGHTWQGTWAGVRSPSMPGPGGFPGGVGGVTAQNGYGPGGGQVTTSGRGGGGGHATPGQGIEEDGPGGGASYGNTFLLPLIGGSGGAGFADPTPSDNGGGGAGGGAILIASSAGIHLTGAVISANGGWAGSGGAGGGAGGAVRLVAPTISGGAYIRANRGYGRPWGTGGSGRIRLEAFENTLQGMLYQKSTISPNIRILPTFAFPSVRIARIAGVDAPAFPTGSFLTPDVTVDLAEGTTATVEIQASNVPPGTPVVLRLISEEVEVGAPDQLLDPIFLLTGNLALSTAIAQVTLPPGFSRVIVEGVIFTP